MKKSNGIYCFVLFCFLITGCNSVNKQIVKKEKINEIVKNLNAEAYFKIIGTEPFWNIEISENKITYIPLDGSKIDFPYNIPITNNINNQRVYKTVNGNGSIEIKLIKGNCSDGMSDKNYNYKAEIEIIQMKKTTRLKGCGFFILSEDFSGKWILKQIQSKRVKLNDNSIIPFLEFDFENNRVSGNAGCNGLSASFSIKNDGIKFSEILLTRMFCEDMSVEKNFIESLNEVNTFKIEGNQLKFYKNGLLEMIFENNIN